MKHRRIDPAGIAGACFLMAALVLLLAMAFQARAAEREPYLVWDASPESEQVREYLIWRNGEVVSTVAGTDDEAPPVEYKIVAPPGVYDYQVQAVNAWGVSPMSDTVSTPDDVPRQPVGVTIRVVVEVIVEAVTPDE